MTTKELFRGLLLGKRYILTNDLAAESQLYQTGQLRHFAPLASLYMDAEGERIYWRHFGSGASRASVDELTWVLKTVFGVGAEAFTELEAEA